MLCLWSSSVLPVLAAFSVRKSTLYTRTSCHLNLPSSIELTSVQLDSSRILPVCSELVCLVFLIIWFQRHHVENRSPKNMKTSFGQVSGQVTACQNQFIREVELSSTT